MKEPLFTFSTPAPMVSVLSNIAHCATSSLIQRNVRTCMTSFRAKNLSRIKLYIIKRILYAIYFLSLSEKLYISFVASPQMKYACFAQINELNCIFRAKKKYNLFIPQGIISNTYINFTLSSIFRPEAFFMRKPSF